MAQEKTATQQTRPKYVIDPDWFEKHSRSLATVLASRMCYNCKVKLEDNPEATVEDLFTSIRDCCSQAEGFLEPGLPLQEAVFRLLLKEGNRPLDIEDIHNRIRDWLMVNRDNRLVSAAVIERIMQNDRFYGFRRLQPAGEEQS